MSTSRTQRSIEGDQPTDDESLDVAVDQDLEESFDRSVEKGAERLNRSWPNLLATGTIAGLEVGLGVLALLFVEHQTGSELLGGLAFTIGFLAIALGRSELFTENFLVPVTTVITGKATMGQLGRLWGGTYLTNLIGGWVIAATIVIGYPDLHETAVSRGEEIIDRGLSLESFVLAVLAGSAITLMTWMERNAETEGGRLISVIFFAFLLSAFHMNHVVVISIKMFAALQVGGTTFGYGDWFLMSLLAVVGNIVGGLMVTFARLVQIGGRHIHRRQHSDLKVSGGKNEVGRV